MERTGEATVKTNINVKGFIPNKLLRSLLNCMIVCIVIIFVAPGIALSSYLNRHIDYKGYITKDYPLQDIYEASDFDLEEKQLNLKTSDGLMIWTSEISPDKPKAVIINLSGIEQPSVTYFYGQAKYMQEMGYASFLLEVRGHGNSEGNRIGLGFEEVKDVQAVVDYIKSNAEYEGVPIVIQGVSMGGAIAVNAFGQIKEIDGLIAMSAYSSFEDVIGDKLKSFGLPSFIEKACKGLLRFYLSLIYGKGAVEQNRPIEQIKNAEGRPVLLVACTGDTEVMVSNTHRLQEANPKANVWIRDSWEHFIIKNCDFVNVKEDEEYCTRIIDFIEKDILK